MLVGDHFYSRCMALLVRDGDLAVMDALAAAMVSMTEAEVFQLERKRAGELSEADYLRIIRQKTATFMSACCRIGGLAGGLDAEASRRSRRTASASASRSRSSTTRSTSPRIRPGSARRSATTSWRASAPCRSSSRSTGPRTRSAGGSSRPLGRPGLQDSDLAEVHRLVKVYDGVGYSVARASAYAEAGIAALGRFPDSPARQILTLIAEYVIHRDR